MVKRTKLITPLSAWQEVQLWLVGVLVVGCIAILAVLALQAR